jgi:hypothetical protein
MFEKRLLRHHPLELGGVDKEIVGPFGLARAPGARRVRDRKIKLGHRLKQRSDETGLARTGRRGNGVQGSGAHGPRPRVRIGPQG